MRHLFSFFILPVVASCAFVPDVWTSKSFDAMQSPARSYSILPPPEQSVFTGSKTVYQNNYVLNQLTSAKVGETVLRVQAYKKDDFISGDLRLDAPVTIKIHTDEIKLAAKRYPIYGMFELDGQPYFVLPKQGHYYFLVDTHGVIQTRFLYDMKGSDKVTLFNDRAMLFPETARMKRVTYFEQSKIPFLDFEVVYDGIKNNQIVLFYKNAVPGTDGGSGSFDTLVYPADSTMISVKGRLLRIIRADREQITYIVVRE